METDSTELLEKNTLYTNYRPEFVAACLIDSGCEKDKVRLIREGKGSGGKSISKISHEYSKGQMMEYVNIYTRKRGLYDTLPEGFFHTRMDIKNKKNKSNVVDSFRRSREIELGARFFFRPFEIAIDRMLINAHLYEMSLEKRTKYDHFVRLLSSHWPILRDLPLDKALFAINLFSQCYRLTTPKQVAEVMSVFLGCEVNIEMKFETITLETDCDWVLGESSLDVNTVIGESIEDSFPVMEVNIKGLRRSQRGLVLEGDAAHKQFMDILDFFVPADAELRFHVEVAQEDAIFFLSDAPDLTPILGFTTILS